MMSVREFLNSGLVEQYVLNLLEKNSDVELVERYIRQYPEVKKYYHQIQDDILKLAKENAITPPQHIKSKVLDKITNSNNTASTARPSNRILSALAGFLFLGLLTLGYFYTKAIQEKAKVEASYEALMKDCEIQKYATAELLDFYQNKNTKSIALKGDNFNSTFYYNKETEQLKLASINQQTLPKGKCFYLWGDIDNKMVKVGRLDEMEIAETFMKFDKNMISLNVTIEDADVEIDHPNVSMLVGSVRI
jgi:hypothetical protein